MVPTKMQQVVAAIEEDNAVKGSLGIPISVSRGMVENCVAVALCPILESPKAVVESLEVKLISQPK